MERVFLGKKGELCQYNPRKLTDCACKMNKLMSPFFALAVASVTVFSSMATPAWADEVKGDASAGAHKIAMCLGCHNIPGYQATFPEVYKVPKVAKGIAASLTDQDIADVAAYYTGLGKVADFNLPDQPAKAPNAEVSALLAKGACTSCHGSNFSKPIDPSYPKLAGQNADYLFVALKAYKTENNATVGRNNGIMGGVAKQFSNNELKALAGYIGSLDSELKTVPESRFH
jgi:cytochrome c553